MTLKDGCLYINDYWINSTGTMYNSIAIHNWFDGFGVAFTPTKNDVILLYVKDKGEPTRVNGASSTFNNVTSILNMTVFSNRYVGVHWNNGGTAYIFKPDLIGVAHSWGYYKSCYGFGILVGTPKHIYGQARLFPITVYIKNQSDLKNVTLQIGESIILSYDANKKGSNAFKEESDPNNFFELRKGLCSVRWNPQNEYLSIYFGGPFKDYSPRMQLQNLTVSVSTTSEGLNSNVNYGAWFVYEKELKPKGIVTIPYELLMPLLGLLGFIMVIFGPYICLRKIQQKDYENAVVFGAILFILGLAFIIAWLWR